MDGWRDVRRFMPPVPPDTAQNSGAPSVMPRFRKVRFSKRQKRPVLYGERTPGRFPAKADADKTRRQQHAMIVHVHGMDEYRGGVQGRDAFADKDKAWSAAVLEGKGPDMKTEIQVQFQTGGVSGPYRGHGKRSSASVGTFHVFADETFRQMLSPDVRSDEDRFKMPNTKELLFR